MANRGDQRKKITLSPTSLMHYTKLVFRSVLLLVALALYVINRVKGTGKLFGGVENDPVILVIILLVFVVAMVLRFFPDKIESMGCQKVFGCNHQPVEQPQPHRNVSAATWGILAAWLGLNGVIAALYFTHIIDTGILILVSLAYSVCDMICILFFCPFQSWFLKNKCCTTCRIYNWDFAMMFTPLVLIPRFYTWSLFGLGLALLLYWELTHLRHPERFYEECNASLKCANCKEEGTMNGNGITIKCSNCGKEYELDELGQLCALRGETEFLHIPHWYAWQRECVKEELLNGTYLLDTPYKIGVMVDYKAIYMVGSGRLIHDKNGFTLTGCDGALSYTQPPQASYGLYADYFWYEIGDVICIGDKNRLYYCFPEKDGVVAKTRMATEELIKLTK